MQTDYLLQRSNDTNHGGCIVIVDDNANNLRTLKAILEDHGFETRAAINGMLALKAIAELQPDMVLLDIMMPDVNAYED